MSTVESLPDAEAASAAPAEGPVAASALAARPATPTKPLGARLALWSAVGWLAFIIAAAVLADVLPLTRYDGFAGGFAPSTPPGLRWPEPLGTDYLGRSMLSRIVFGARVSLLIAAASVVIGSSLGVAVGLASGYLRGKVDTVTSVMLDVVLAFPPLVLLLTIAAIGGRNTGTIVGMLAALVVPGMARLVRARTISVAEREFVLAARGMGAGPLRIMVREILPHVLPLVLALAFLMTGVMMIAEGGLSFLGLGVPPPRPTWGGIISDGRAYFQGSPHLIFVPSACLVATVLAFRTVGFRLGSRFVVDARR